MSRTLSPLQEAIVKRVTHLERLPEKRLRDYLGTYFRGLDESDEAWCHEFALAMDLLVLYGLVRIEDHPRNGRMLIDARRDAARGQVGAVAEPGRAGQPEADPSRIGQLPAYGDGTSVPSRIEQFFNGRSMVYRYCQDDECPSPTPKVAVAAVQRAETQRYEAVATVRQAVTQGTAAGVAAGAFGKFAKAAPPDVKPAATLVAATFGAVMGAASKAVGAAAPTMLASLTTTETPPAGFSLRADGDFTSYKGMVGFQQGSMVLDGLSRHKVAELAPNAREADRVRLRGRVATTQLSEDMKKLAVGRAYAVKVEFVKHKVDKAKIRILSPQQSSGDNATGTVRGVDVTIDMPEKKYLSGTVKDGA